MRVLVTGAAGFIGSHITERLVRDGHDVVGLDNLRTGKRENLASVASSVDFVAGDIRDTGLLRRLMNGCDCVFHKAAIVSVPYSVEHPDESHEVNLRGTLDVLLAARDANVRRVVFASSAAVYGDDPTLPKTETSLTVPISPYGVEKLAAENYCMVFSQLYPLEAVALRYFNVFGPRQDPGSPYSGVISIFVNRLLARQGVTIFGDGEQTRDFVFVDDVVEANVLASTAPEAAGKRFNVGRGEQTSLLSLVASLQELEPGDAFTVTHADPRDGDIRHSLADISLAREVLGYEPRSSVQEGLRHLLESGA